MRTLQANSPLRALFERALERPAGERHSFLAATCPDAALRTEVEALLAAHEGHVPFLDAGTPAALEHGLPPGSRLGPYEVLAVLGRGGMGVVYRARRADLAFEKDVAVKVLRADLEGGEARRRLRRERQILARLEHPHIARLLDGGETPDGRPYVVMEHVAGTPVDRYCREAQLGLDARLRLMLAVCEAVRYAHRHLVVHRDLKPTNILVSPEGHPKLLDFGIAKLLEPEGDGAAEPPTRTGWQLMTPEYASPEQVRGEPITTASDVYSLGVLLYELITGVRPYRPAGPSLHELAQAVCEQQPLPPSAALPREDRSAGAPVGTLPAWEGGVWRLRRRLAGSLDTLVLTALHKQPERRYDSAAELAEDLRRHLAREPLRARGEGWRARAAKFVRRHRAGVVAALLLGVSLLAGLGATVWQARRAQAARVEAERQQRRAERRFADVRRLANSVLFEVHDAIADLPGATHARRLVAARALEYLDSLAREAAGDVLLQQELAAAYERLADVLGGLGDVPGMGRSLEQAQGIRETLSAAHPQDPHFLAPLAVNLLRRGDNALAAGDALAAVGRFTRAAELAGRLTAQPVLGPAMHRVLADAEGRLCNTLAASGAAAAALERCRAQRLALGSLLDAAPGDRKLREAAAWNEHFLGHALRLTGQAREARRELLSALRGFEGLLRVDAPSAGAGRGLAATHMRLATTLLDLREPVAALESFAAAETRLRVLAAADPQAAAFRVDLAYVLLRRVGPLLDAGRRQAARRSAVEGLELLRRPAESPTATALDLNEYAWWLATCPLPELRRPARALELAQRAVAQAPGPNPVILHTLAWALQRNGRRDQALAALDRALALVSPGTGAALGLRREIEADRARFASRLEDQEREP